MEEQRAVLLLVMLEGLSYREVADIQGADRDRDVALARPAVKARLRANARRCGG